MTALSILDLVSVREGTTPGDSLAGSLEAARAAERLGYRRYWVSEHHNMVGVASAATAVVVADTDGEARRLFTTVQQMFTGMVRGTRGLMSAPIDDIETHWTAIEKAHASRMLACSFVGSPATVRDALAGFIARTGADELMVHAPVFDEAARIRSMELLAGVAGELDGRAAAA